MELINTLGSLIVILFRCLYIGYGQDIILLDVKRKVIVLIENVPIGECVNITDWKSKETSYCGEWKWLKPIQERIYLRLKKK